MKFVRICYLKNSTSIATKSSICYNSVIVISHAKFGKCRWIIRDTTPPTNIVIFRSLRQWVLVQLDQHVHVRRALAKKPVATASKCQTPSVQMPHHKCPLLCAVKCRMLPVNISHMCQQIIVYGAPPNAHLFTSYLTLLTELDYCDVIMMQHHDDGWSCTDLFAPYFEYHFHVDRNSLCLSW